MPNTINISNKRGLLRVSAENARYLIDNSGKPIFLAGFHTWYTVQDGGGTSPPPALDWTAYVAALVSYGCNWTKLWAMETGRGWSDVIDQWYTPTRYTRTGPGNDNDGKLKFDLTQINPDYTNRLVSRCRDLEKNKIYFVVQLFQGWQIEDKGLGQQPATYHPYLSANNINSVSGDQNSDGKLTETHFNTGANVVQSYQNAMVDAIIDATNGFSHLVAYEISNEDTGSTDNTGWQNDMISHIHTYEATKPHQHLVMMSWQYPSGSNANIDGSNADVYSYGANDSAPLSSPFTPTHANMFDTDHSGGLTATYEWMWRGLCRGNGGCWYMDEWDGALYGTDRRNNATYILIRNNLGYLLTLTKLLRNLLLMTSQGSLCSTGWCLARDHATVAEYICFQDGSGDFTLNLTNATGTLNIRWLRCSDGTVTDSATTTGGATRTLSPPWAGVVVAYVRHL